ncbi:putative AbiEii toxin of type IV toxin-antitoxin system [Sphingomonas aurantiaca]|uniref:Putative AbiEii toxin of type IV toxin-antitoxin system n=1 Tax=Sphingomonas aurantiaca TaxID=185949 RepID=A0A2T5GFV5_9SPHN|nr:AAA family ATPase [Sphingomonas aurantiaca]PTQ58204.1 putative AbiEii toxin of type IV toxin-antitoxin system [Sphingomonas aurantiaca]
MHLESIRVEKFKRIDAIDLPLADLNILVGSNGSGKSSILQALHLASCLMRQADRIRMDGTAMVRVSDLDYLPSDEYWRLGHGADWGNRSNSPSSKVIFKFRANDGAEVIAHLEMRSARNAGISVQGELPELVRTQFRGAETFFSGFIPGISGIPNVEQKNSKRVVLKACSFGDSNVYLRNALNLLSLENIGQIETWLMPLLGRIKLSIKFDDAADFDIHAEAEINGIIMPLELLGTGYLQLIQIFCYILLFKPKILLVDEPDIHLHPSVQEQLAQILLEIARAQGIKIIMTTHSPFIVRGAPADTNVVWLADGEKKSDDRASVELALGWGAFGKKVIVVSEDAKNDLLKKLIRQWPEIERAVTVLPGRGYQHLLTKDEARELKASLGDKFKILVHRDRDSLTDDEVIALKDSYASEGIRLWLTDQSDLEAEFCDPGFLSALTGEPIHTCENWLTDISNQNQAPIKDQFAKQRAAHNDELHKAGGSPTNDDVWAVFQGRTLKGAKGKFIFNQLKNKVPANGFSAAAVGLLAVYPERAASLKANLEDLLA